MQLLLRACVLYGIAIIGKHRIHNILLAEGLYGRKDFQMDTAVGIVGVLPPTQMHQIYVEEKPSKKIVHEGRIPWGIRTTRAVARVVITGIIMNILSINVCNSNII